MILDLFEFSRQSQKASGVLSAGELARLDLADCEGSVRWHARGGRDQREQRNQNILEVDIVGQVGLVCQRCLEPMRHAIEVHARYRVMRSEAEADAAPLDDDEFDPVVGAKDFDLAALVEDEVLLSLPVVPKHERCPAPAPVVSDARASEAESKSVAGSAGKPSPFAVLSGFKVGGGKKN